MTTKLLTPSREWLHPELDLHIEGIVDLVARLDKTGHVIPNIFDLNDNEGDALLWFLNLPRYGNEDAISAPILHPDICDELIQYIAEHEDQFKANDEEETEYQIPELVLSSTNPALFKSLLTFAKNSLFLLYNLYWGKHPHTVESIQLAKYTASGIKKTEWHHDANSNMTAVINLAPELYTGGGTDIRTSILRYEHIKPVPKGHALIFNGNSLLHRGAKMESGDRNLLVFWITTDRKVGNL